MHSKYLLLFVFLLVAIPSFPQGMGTNAGCNFAGTWYGGSPDAPNPYYQLTINPISADRFLIVAQLAVETQSAGYLHATQWTGEFSKTDPHSYGGMLFSMWQWDPNAAPPGVDASLPEMDFIHMKMVEFLDCDTIRISYDMVAVYFNFTNGMSPRELPPPPGFVQTFDPLLVEVYHRMPTSFPAAFMAAGVTNEWVPLSQGKAGRKGPFGERK